MKQAICVSRPVRSSRACVMLGCHGRIHASGVGSRAIGTPKAAKKEPVRQPDAPEQIPRPPKSAMRTSQQIGRVAERTAGPCVHQLFHVLRRNLAVRPLRPRPSQFNRCEPRRLQSGWSRGGQGF